MVWGAAKLGRFWVMMLMLMAHIRVSHNLKLRAMIDSFHMVSILEEQRKMGLLKDDYQNVPCQNL